VIFSEREIFMEQFQVLDIKKIFESPLNPRRTFNEKKMEELIESIRTKGILMPLLVRPAKSKGEGEIEDFASNLGVKLIKTHDSNQRYEIAAGHRRYRAAIKVQLREVPVIVREMSDADFLEVITIENLQREDIEPLDEAQGYQTLMMKTNYDVSTIAAKVGKSESYIYQRIKLLDLIPEAQEQLIKNKITAGHAILIARLQPDQQKELIKKESGLYEGWGPDRTVVSVRELADHIDRQIHLDLNSASFKKNDPDLVPEAGPCTTCHKRTGFVPALFPEIKKKDTCTDPSCFHKKVEAFTKQWIEKKSQDSDVPPLRLSTNYDGRIKKVPEDPEKPIPSQLYHEITDKKKGSCSSAREGIVVEGRHEGQVKIVCIDPECKKHHKTASSYTSSSQNDPRRVRQKAEEEKRKLAFKIREAILDAILSAWPGKFNREDLLVLAAEVYRPIWHENQKKILKRKGLIPKKEQYSQNTQAPMATWLKNQKEKELRRFLLECVLFQNLERHWTDKGKPDPIIETAKRYGLDPKKIEMELRNQIKEKKTKKKKPAQVQTSAKKKIQTNE
jgi:ParB family chromosome partitioning protein